MQGVTPHGNLNFGGGTPTGSWIGSEEGVKIKDGDFKGVLGVVGVVGVVGDGGRLGLSDSTITTRIGEWDLVGVVGRVLCVTNFGRKSEAI